MKLTISLADAVLPKPDVSALKLGVTRISVDASQGGHFAGGMVLIADPEEGDEPGEREFAVHVQLPSGTSQQIARGSFKLGPPRDQLVIAGQFVMPIEGYGEYVFRFESSGQVAETHIIVKGPEQ